VEQVVEYKILLKESVEYKIEKQNSKQQ